MCVSDTRLPFVFDKNDSSKERPVYEHPIDIFYMSLGDVIVVLAVESLQGVISLSIRLISVIT